MRITRTHTLDKVILELEPVEAQNLYSFLIHTQAPWPFGTMVHRLLEGLSGETPEVIHQHAPQLDACKGSA